MAELNEGIENQKLYSHLRSTLRKILFLDIKYLNIWVDWTGLFRLRHIVKLRRGSGKDWQGMAVKAKGVKA